MSGVVGPILGAFGKTKVTQQLYNDALGKAITGSANAVGANRAANDADLAAYSAANRGAAARTEGLLSQDNAALGNLIGRASAYDPMAAYRGIGDYQTGLFNQFARGLADQGKAAQNLQFARMGYGGNSGGTYTGRSVMDRISGNLAPAYASVLGNIGRDVGALNQAAMGQASQASNLINQRIGMQGAGAQYLLNPALARSQLAQEESANLGQLGGAAKTNTAGFRAEKDLVGRLGEGIGEAEGTVLDTAMSLLSMYTGGGLGGGLGGMMGGGGGGKGSSSGPKAPTSQAFTFIPSGGGSGYNPYETPSYYRPSLQY